MSLLGRSDRHARLGVSMLVLLGLGVASLPSVSAQTRLLASLGDVPTIAPAPYHPHNLTSSYGSSLYDEPYHGVYRGSAAHYWY